MSVVQELSSREGFFVLSAAGNLGRYDTQGGFVADAWLNDVLHSADASPSTSMADNPDRDHRLGVIYQAANKPWASYTLALDAPVVRGLYPVSGTRSDMLTGFQQKNREKSIYRAMELLLEYRDEAQPGSVVYFPVLRDAPPDAPPVAPATTPGSSRPLVRVEVLNLAELLPLAFRTSTQLAQLRASLYQQVVRKELRRKTGLELADAAVNGPADFSTAEPSPDAYAEIDKRADRRVQLPETTAHKTAVPPADGASPAPESMMERWRQSVPAPVEPKALGGFNVFRGLDIRVLTLLSPHIQVHKAPAGTVLLEQGSSDNWNMYLLSGTVRLDAGDGGTEIVTGGTEKARNAIARLKPRKYAVTTVTPVSFLWVGDAMLAALARAQSPVGRSATA
jgi:hypothetical protein